MAPVNLVSEEGRVIIIKLLNASQLTTAIGFLIVLVTASVSRNIRRHITWYSFCSSLLLASVSCSLLTLTGQQFRVPPDFTICLIQATLLNGVAALIPSTRIALILHLWLSMHSVLFGEKPKAKWKDISLVAFPCFVTFAAFVASIVDGALDHNSVQKVYAQCVIKTGSLRIIIASWDVFTMSIGVILEFLIAKTLYRNWQAFKGLSTGGTHTISMLIRVALFTVFDIMALFVALEALADPGEPIYDIVPRLLTFAALLIFGTQKDLVDAWIFRRTTPIKVEQLTLHSVDSVDKSIIHEHSRALSSCRTQDPPVGSSGLS